MEHEPGREIVGTIGDTSTRRSKRLLDHRGRKEIQLGEIATLVSIRKEKQSLSRPGLHLTSFPVINILSDRLLIHMACLCGIELADNTHTISKSRATWVPR